MARTLAASRRNVLYMGEYCRVDFGHLPPACPLGTHFEIADVYDGVPREGIHVLQAFKFVTK